MTAYRLHVGPVPGPLGPFHEVLHILSDGTVVSAAGASVEDALARLEAEPDTDGDWTGATQLAAYGGNFGEPATLAQKAAALRHLLALLDPGLKLDCPQDIILVSLFSALALLHMRGPSLRDGSSFPVHFDCEGIYEGTGHAILSAYDQGISCLVMGSAADVRAVYEAGLPFSPQLLGVNMIGVLTSRAPDWAQAPLVALTGQPVAPELFVRVRGAEVPFGPKSALLLALLAATWPQNPVAMPQSSLVELPVGRARVKLSPVDWET